MEKWCLAARVQRRWGTETSPPPRVYLEVTGSGLEGGKSEAHHCPPPTLSLGLEPLCPVHLVLDVLGDPLVKQGLVELWPPLNFNKGRDILQLG